MTGDEPEGFLGRWSRIKRTAARASPDPAPEADTPPGTGAAPEAGPADAAPEEANPAPETTTLSDEELAALPRIEDLVQGSDIRPFLRAGVPRSLRNAALRRMWMLTPAIRDYRDPAVDYAWDWNTPGGVPGDGVAPSPERAAQMLRSLLDPRPQGGPAGGAEDGGMAASPERETDPQPAAEAPSGPASDLAEDPSHPVDGPVTAGAQDMPAPDAPPDPPPRRRHGSALPG